jgi:hypothetical protein
MKSGKVWGYWVLKCPYLSTKSYKNKKKESIRGNNHSSIPSGGLSMLIAAVLTLPPEE